MLNSRAITKQNKIIWLHYNAVSEQLSQSILFCIGKRRVSDLSSLYYAAKRLPLIGWESVFEYSCIRFQNQRVHVSENNRCAHPYFIGNVKYHSASVFPENIGPHMVVVLPQYYCVALA